MTQALERSTIRRKAQEVEQLVSSIDLYNVIAFASLHKVRAIQLQELAKRFRSDILLKTAKNVLVKRALERSTKRNINELTKHMVGSNLLLLTDMDPFKLSILLGKNKIKTTAKAGDIAQNDITIPAGNTGLPPGPAGPLSYRSTRRSRSASVVKTGVPRVRIVIPTMEAAWLSSASPYIMVTQPATVRALPMTTDGTKRPCERSVAPAHRAAALAPRLGSAVMRRTEPTVPHEPQSDRTATYRTFRLSRRQLLASYASATAAPFAAAVLSRTLVHG